MIAGYGGLIPCCSIIWKLCMICSRCQCQRLSQHIIAPNMGIGTHYGCRHDPAAPEPGAVNSKVATIFSRLIKGVFVQQHLNFVEKPAPIHAICAEWQ